MKTKMQQEKYDRLFEMCMRDISQFRGMSRQDIYNRICGHFCMVDFKVVDEVSRDIYDIINARST